MEREERFEKALAEASGAGLSMYGPQAASEDRHLWAVRFVVLRALPTSLAVAPRCQPVLMTDSSFMSCWKQDRAEQPSCMCIALVTDSEILDLGNLT